VEGSVGGVAGSGLSGVEGKGERKKEKKREEEGLVNWEGNRVETRGEEKRKEATVKKRCYLQWRSKGE